MDHRPLAADPVQASFPSRLDSVALLLEWLEQHRPPGVDAQLWVQAQTALVEGFSNAVRHAHAQLDPAPAVVVTLEVTPQHLQVQLRDQGPPSTSPRPGPFWSRPMPMPTRWPRASCRCGTPTGAW